MRRPCLAAQVTAALLMALAAMAGPATAAQISGDASTVTYTAGPGENNRVLVTTSQYDTACGGLPAPCLSVTEGGAALSGVTGTCVVESAGLWGTTAVCPIPQTVRADLGDGDDAWWD